MSSRNGRALPPSVAVLAILVVVGFLAAGPIDRALKSGLEVELRGLDVAFENRSGFTLRYDSLSPSILVGLEVRGLVIGTHDGRKILSARRVALRYDPASLLFGTGSPFITSVLIEGADASLTSRDIDKLVAMLRQGGAADSRGIVVPRVRFEARDLRLEIPDLDGFRIAFDARHLAIDSRKSIPSLSLDGNLSGTAPLLGGISTSLSVAGSFSRALDAARIRIGISAQAKDFALKRQDFDLSLDQGIVELQKARDSSPIDIYARYELASQTLSANLRSDAFDPDSLFSASHRLSFLTPWFAEQWSSSISLSMTGWDPSTLRYEGIISGRLPRAISGGKWDVRVDASGDAGHLVVNDAVASGPEGIFRLEGKADLRRRMVDGRLEIDTKFLDGRLPVKADIAFSGSSGEYRIESRNIRAAGVDFDSCELSLGFDEKSSSTTFHLSIGLPQVPPGRGTDVGLPPPRLDAIGSISTGSQPLIECALTFGLIDGNAFAPFLSSFTDERTSSAIESLSIAGNAIFRSDFSHFSWSTTGLSVKTRLLPGFEALVSASGSDQDFRLRASTFSYRGYSAQLSGDLSYEGPDMYSFGASLLYAGVPYTFQGTLIRGGFNLAGNYGLVASGRIVDGAVIGTFGIGSLPLPIQGIPLSVSAAASFRWVSSGEWSIALSGASIIPSSLGGSIPGFSFSGLFGPQGGTIATARLFDRISTVSGSGTVGWGQGRAKLDMRLGAPSDEHYDIGASFGDGNLSATLTFGSSPLSRFVQKQLTGSLDGSLKVDGPLDSLEIGYDLALRQGQFNGSPVDLHMTGSLRSTDYGIDDGSVQWQGFRLSAVKGDFDLLKKRGTIAGRFDSAVVLPGSTFGFSSNIVARSDGSTDSSSDVALTGEISDFAYGSIRNPKWPFSADISPRGIFVQGGPGADFSLSFSSDGSFAVRAKSPFPILVDLQGRTQDNRIEAEARGISIEMPMLVALVGQLPVDFKGGKLVGDLMMSGPTADPEFSGVLRLVDCSLSMPGWINETAGPITAPVVVDGKRLLLHDPSVPILSSRFALDFELDFEGWSPNGLKVAMKSLPDTQVPIDTNILGVAIKGFAVPNIDLTLAGQVLSIRGDLALQNTDVIVTPQTLAPSESGGGSQQTLLDIDLGIETARGVHFYFPDRNYPVIAGNVVPGNHLSVRYDQSRDFLSFKGEIDARGGDAFYIQRNFFLRSAKVVFNENSEKAFDPLVSMQAELHDSTADGPITVTLSADNQPISVFRPSITSDPPKSESDIALILGQQLFALDEAGGINLGRIAIAGSEFVPQLNITKAFESRIRDALNLDVFYFDSQVVQRLLFSLAGTGTQGLSTLSDYLKETSLFAGKYLSDSVFLNGSVRLDANPLVTAGSLKITSNLGIDFNFGVDFETPFGLLQWTFQPAHLEPQMFVDDQSLSLSWRIPLK